MDNVLLRFHAIAGQRIRSTYTYAHMCKAQSRLSSRNKWCTRMQWDILAGTWTVMIGRGNRLEINIEYQSSEFWKLTSFSDELGDRAIAGFFGESMCC